MENLSFLKQISEVLWEIPPSFKKGMRVAARIVATEKLLKEMDAGVLEQITNVATLPGITGYAYAMPDAHWGYGAPIGTVFSTDIEKDGVISPGAVGFDINCGMRLIRSKLTKEEVLPRLEKLVNLLFERIPAGVGARGFVKLNKKEFAEVATQGAAWCVKHGFGKEEDLERTEENGKILGANPDTVSNRAMERGLFQLGTLGSGNHYLEVQRVEPANIYDKNLAQSLGIFENQVVVMVHCGSRGFGHQIGTDYLKSFGEAMKKYQIEVPDRQLACAPFNSSEGQNYYAAMVSAANTAFANRQIITQKVREVFSQIFEKNWEDLGLEIVYDVAHNIAKVEEYFGRKLLVHRKGATRAFNGQPVIIGGSMETGSYLLMGTKKAEEETFGSTTHGSGRTMSRHLAKRMIGGKDLAKIMKEKGIYVRSVSSSGLAEEMGAAYKDIAEVVLAVEKMGISQKVCSFKPIGNIKG